MKTALAWTLALAPSLALAAGSLTGGGMIELLVTLIVVGLICWVVWWLISYLGLPEPFNKVARVLVALIAAIFVINLLLSLIGKPLF